MNLFRRAASGEKESQCVVHPFGREVSTASYAMYTFSAAVLVQALVLVSFSAVADHGKFSSMQAMQDQSLTIIARYISQEVSSRIWLRRIAI